MRLTFLGHAAVRLEVGDHENLVDPFLSGNPVAAASADDLAPGHVLLTHGHHDHLGDHFTMGPDDAVEAVRLLAPREVVPIHYDTFPQVRQDAQAFRARVEAETDARCRVLAPGDGLDL